MPSVNFLVDDFGSTNRFVKGLPDKIKKARFATDLHTGKLGRWTPDHVVLACVDGVVVAMADGLYSRDGGTQKGANASLVALDGFGGYAVRALLILKNHFPAARWESTLVNPTPSTAQISRRYFDVTYDQTAWDLSQGLMQRHGMDARLLPLPIVLSRTTLRTYGFASLNAIDGFSRKQILQASIDGLGTNLIAPNGKEMAPPMLLTFAFELLDFPLDKRQQMARLLLMVTASGLGFVKDQGAAATFMNPHIVKDYHVAVTSALPQLPSGRGIFGERRAPVDFSKMGSF